MLTRAACLLIAPLMFAQSPAPFSTPETFGTALNPEGTTAYFSRSSGAGKPPSLMASHLRNGRWTEAELLPFAGQGEGDPAMAPDGSRLVFWSWRPSRNKAESKSPVPDLWYVDVSSGRYGEPRNITNSAGYGGPSLAADGTLYCFRGPAPGGKPRLVRALRSGDGYGPFENLPDEFIGGFDPFIAPDQSYIIFASEPGDLYISYRRGQGWAQPVNLGPKVNSSEQEYCPSVSRDGRSLYFTRARQGVFVAELADLGIEAAQQTRTEVTKPTPGDSKPNSEQVPDVYAISGQFERILVLRFKYQADLLAGIESMVKRHKIRNAVILAGAGSVRGYHVHSVSNRTFPSKNIYIKDPAAPADIASMNGYIIDGRIHAHLTMTDPDKAFGGHLESGTTVFTFAVVTLGVFGDGVDLSRIDDKTYR